MLDHELNPDTGLPVGWIAAESRTVVRHGQFSGKGRWVGSCLEPNKFQSTYYVPPVGGRSRKTQWEKPLVGLTQGDAWSCARVEAQGENGAWYYARIMSITTD